MSYARADRKTNKKQTDSNILLTPTDSVGVARGLKSYQL